jgi:hypothetical protein
MKKLLLNLIKPFRYLEFPIILVSIMVILSINILDDLISFWEVFSIAAGLSYLIVWGMLIILKIANGKFPKNDI